MFIANKGAVPVNTASWVGAQGQVKADYSGVAKLCSVTCANGEPRTTLLTLSHKI